MHTSEDYEFLLKKLEEKLSHKTELLERERKHSEELRRKISELERTFNVNPKDKWYLIYLMKELATHERLHEKQQGIIFQYQQHFARYGRFYEDLEKRLHPPTIEPELSTKEES